MWYEIRFSFTSLKQHYDNKYFKIWKSNVFDSCLALNTTKSTRSSKSYCVTWFYIIILHEFLCLFQRSPWWSSWLWFVLARGTVRATQLWLRSQVCPTSLGSASTRSCASTLCPRSWRPSPTSSAWAPWSWPTTSSSCASTACCPSRPYSASIVLCCGTCTL